MGPALTSLTAALYKSKSRLGEAGFAKHSGNLRAVLQILSPEEKLRFALLILCDTLISIIDIFSLALLLWIVQFYIQPPEKTSLSFLPQWLVSRDSVALIALFFFVFSLKNLAAFFVSRSQHNFNAGVAVRISENALTAYQNGAFKDFTNMDSSVHVRKIGYQPFDFCLYLLSGIQQIITQSFLILLATIAILVFNARLFFFLLVILLPPVITIFYFIKKHLTRTKEHLRHSNQKSLQYLMDALKGYVEGNIYKKNNFFIQRFIQQRHRFSRYLFQSLSIQTLPGRLIEIFAVLGLFLLIIIARWTENGNPEALLTIGAFMAAAYKIIPGMVRIINVSGQIKTHEFPITELLLDTNSVSQDVKQPTSIQSLRFSRVHFQFGNLPVLNELSFTVEKGDFMCLFGKSGKGKTTTFNLLLGFLSPQHGQILINDALVTARDVRNYWPNMAYVKQQSFFIHDTVLRNITLQEEEHNEEKLQEAVAASGLADLIEAWPEGLYKIITENGKNISGGQQQRIALARALYTEADLILLDEPFNELDEPSEWSLLQHLKELADSGKIVILITHNKNALGFCNKTVSLDSD